MRRGGFTLIEVMAVVLLLGLLAGSTIWLMTRQARRSQADLAVIEITGADRDARLAARRTRPQCLLRIDLNRQEVYRVRRDAAGRETRSHRVSPPAGIRIARVLVAEAETAGASASARRGVSNGVVEIPFSPAGRSPTYAVALESEQTRTWLVVSGLTGQTSLEENDKNVENLFATLATGRPDAP